MKQNNIQTSSCQSELYNEPVELAQKLHAVADVLRNNNGIIQIRNRICKSETQVCALGLMALHSGINAKDLKSWHNKEMKIYEKYGITKSDNNHVVDVPYRSIDHFFKKKDNLLFAIVRLNDRGYSFNQIADFVDDAANKLQK